MKYLRNIHIDLVIEVDQKIIEENLIHLKGVIQHQTIIKLDLINHTEGIQNQMIV